MFTAAAALKLRDAHRLSFDDPICRFFDPCPDAWKPILIKHLIGHTSGIPDYESKLELGSAKYLDFMPRPGASRQIIDDARKLPLDFPPGTQFNYSKTGYILLSDIVEKASGMPFARYIEKELLRPAGMTRSGVIDSQRLPAELALGYTHDELGWEKTVAGVELTAENNHRVPQLSLTSPEGDAFLYSTVDDLYKWSQVMDGAKPNVLPKNDLSTVFTDNGFGYALGWFVGKGFGETRYRHNGALPGYWTDFIKFPDKGITIVMVSNIPARLSSIARDLSLMMLGKPYDMPVRGHVVTLQNEQITALEGTYKWPDGRVLTITNKPDYLTAVLEKQFTAGLIPISATSFYFPLGDGIATFQDRLRRTCGVSQHPLWCRGSRRNADTRVRVITRRAGDQRGSRA